MSPIHSILIILQVLGLVVLAERFTELYMRRKVKNLYFSDKIVSYIRLRRDYHSSPELKKHFKLPIFDVANAAPHGLESMNYVLMDEQREVERNSGFLAIFGNVATLLGLIGTIVGMIKAFGVAGAATDLATKKTLLTQGISEAMLYTAHGLFVAIPFLIAYAVFTNRANMLSDDLNKASLKIYIAWEEVYGRNSKNTSN